MINKKAFTIVEVIVTLIIAASLAAISVPYLKSAMDRATQVDACADLKGMSLGQQSYFEHHQNPSQQHVYYSSASCDGSADDTSGINTNLEIRISRKTGVLYCCNGTKDCKAYVNGAALTISSAQCQQ
jgi:prepilin-type N-terminal cleavage/methylation domain-containing protein